MNKLTKLYEHIMTIDYEHAEAWEKKLEESIVRYNRVNADSLEVKMLLESCSADLYRRFDAVQHP